MGTSDSGKIFPPDIECRVCGDILIGDEKEEKICKECQQRNAIPTKQVMTFINWLAYEHNLYEIYGDMTVKQMQENDRVFTIELGKLIESCGYNTLGELVNARKEIV